MKKKFRTVRKKLKDKKKIKEETEKYQDYAPEIAFSSKYSKLQLLANYLKYCFRLGNFVLALF